MGAPKKAAEARRLEGGTKSRGAVSHRPQPRTAILSPRMTEENKPEPPEQLPPAARELWDAAIQQLIDINAAQAIDVPALYLMSIHWEIAVRAWQVLCEEGYFVRGSTGQATTNPALSVFRENSAAFKSWATEFGLTTLARTRLGAMELERTSLAHDLLQRGLGRNPRQVTQTT